jgi:hypothetical protein
MDGDGLKDLAVGESTPGGPRVVVVFGRQSDGSLFIRGDSDGTGFVDITDAVYVLRHLFQGGPAPGCQDAADVDDDGGLVLTDAVYLLVHLFQGGPPPPPPYPGPGRDTTDDGLNCEK